MVLGSRSRKFRNRAPVLDYRSLGRGLGTRHLITTAQGGGLGVGKAMDNTAQGGGLGVGKALDNTAQGGGLWVRHWTTQHRVVV